MSDSIIGEIPSYTGAMTTHQPLQPAIPRTPEQEMILMNARRSDWEVEEQSRRERRAKLAGDLAEAIAKSDRLSAELPHLREMVATLYACKGEDKKRWMRQPVEYGNEIRRAEQAVSDAELATAEPARLRANLEKLDAELVGAERELFISWNSCDESMKKFFLKKIGMSETGFQLWAGRPNLVSPLPLTRK